MLGCGVGAASAAEGQSVLLFEVEGGANAMAFAQQEGDDILVETDLLTSLGLKAPTNAANGRVRLRSVSGLSFTINEATASVRIICTAACYETNALRQEVDSVVLAPALSGVFLNYDLSASHALGVSQAGGVFEGVAFAGASRLEASALAQSGAGVRRLDTTWVSERPGARTSFRIGDSISRAGASALPVRYAGLKFGSDFSLDPAFVTYPVPALSGAAGLPSTLDIYLNSTLRQSRTAPAGPFTITDPADRRRRQCCNDRHHRCAWPPAGGHAIVLPGAASSQSRPIRFYRRSWRSAS